MDIQLLTPSGLEILIVDPDESAAGMLKNITANSGYQVVAAVHRPEDLASAIEKNDPSVILFNPGGFETPFLEALRKLPTQLKRPTLMLSTTESPNDVQNAVQSGVSAHLVVGINGNRLRAGIDMAVANYTNVAFLKQELDDAREALESRKIIERAKGLVMKHKNLGEEEAYTLMRNRAMERGVRMIEIARTITEAAELID